MRSRIWGLLVALLLGSSASFGNIQQLSIDGAAGYTSSIVKLSTEDVRNLLQEACKCNVGYDLPEAQVRIQLPKEERLLSGDASLSRSPVEKINYKRIPLHDFMWKGEQMGNTYVLTLSAPTYQGISAGLYALLQEQLGFAFYHPRQNSIPTWENWPLQGPLLFSGKPVFDKKGFHLHTQHPLELTEQLHDGTIPCALDDIKAYINWLVRNGQNYMEFCLLESIDRKKWPTHAAAIVSYAHSRGILAGVDFSLHMIQQKTFQLYKTPPQSFKAKQKQVIESIDWLMQADWDYLNMEFATAEFVGGNQAKKENLRLLIIKHLAEKYPRTKLMGRQHVVKHDNEKAVTGKHFTWDSTKVALDRLRGVMSHTVMCYDMTEPNAPVYENQNQRHMFAFLLQQHAIRETWYYPESAYWVTFDNSIPLFLLPYLSARLADIDTCEAYRIPGHLTFSSGWEWGYWLIDWSISRWSWNYAVSNSPIKKTPLMYVQDMMQKAALQPTAYSVMQTNLQLQQKQLKEQNLIQWLTAMSITDELPFGLNTQFMPRPGLSYRYLHRKASKVEIDSIRTTILPALMQFYTSSTQSLASAAIHPIEQEWQDGLRITALRSLHRYYTLAATLHQRERKLGLVNSSADSLLKKAAETRRAAQNIVKQREKNYRYPLSLIATPFRGHTSYDFGYLYPVSELQYWYREEEQVRHNRYFPLYKTIFNPWRIIGLVD